MLRTPIIRSILAGIVFILFAFSITPKRWLHNVVATHKDVRSDYLPVSEKDQVGKTTFHCPCDNLIAESPFVFHESVSDFFISITYPVHLFAPGDSFLSSDSFCFGLRGPPAA